MALQPSLTPCLKPAVEDRMCFKRVMVIRITETPLASTRAERAMQLRYHFFLLHSSLLVHDVAYPTKHPPRETVQWATRRSRSRLTLSSAPAILTTSPKRRTRSACGL